MSTYLKELQARLEGGTNRRTKGRDAISSALEIYKNQQARVMPQATNPPVGGNPNAPAVSPTGTLYKGKDESDTLMGRLNQMLKDAPGSIGLGKTSRSYEEQVRLWNNYQAGKGPQAARPGTSKHGNGRANDLKYSDDATRQWVLDNADRYGLALPIYNPKLPRHLDESWHIEVKKGT